MRLKRFCCWFSALALVFFGVTRVPEAYAVVPSEYVVKYDQGYDTGYPVGYDYGFDLGFERGADEGTVDGETEGYDDGWDMAYDPAFETAYAQSLPIGKVDGYADAFPAAALEGYQWASEVHAFFLINHYAVLTLVDRWGDPSGWGSSDITISGSSIFFSWDNSASGLIWLTQGTSTDWAAHYYDEGYDDGHDDGKTVGDEEGFDEAYPLAFEAAYEPAFDQGSKEGTFQGLIDGGEEGYDDGWAVGLNVGESVGFLAGADLYVAGEQLENLDLAVFVASYASSLAVAESASVPEPTSLFLVLFGLTLAAGQLRNRPKS